METWKFWACDNIRNEHIEFTNLFFHNCVSVFGLGSVKGWFPEHNGIGIPYSFSVTYPEMMYDTPNILNGAKIILSVLFNAIEQSWKVMSDEKLHLDIYNSFIHSCVTWKGLSCPLHYMNR